MARKKCELVWPQSETRMASPAPGDTPPAQEHATLASFPELVLEPSASTNLHVVAHDLRMHLSKAFDDRQSLQNTGNEVPDTSFGFDP